MNLVAGATGRLGGEICRLLAERGKPVRALVRSTSDPERVEWLWSLGVEAVEGDLKDRASLERACVGATAVLSTATVIRSRQEGDSFDRCDRKGQLDLVDAAERGGVARFVYVSFGEIPLEFPFQDAKRAVEQRLCESAMTYTILRPGLFIEGWLGPALGWDLAAGRVRIWGEGDARQNWVSIGDVAQVAVGSLDDPRAENTVLDVAGDYASWNDARRQLEEATGKAFEVEQLPLDRLQARYDAATDAHDRTFAALGLAIASGDPSERTGELRRWVARPTTIREYASRVARA
jgi:NADH dehydrogenase